jgi:hypothetical protein
MAAGVQASEVSSLVVLGQGHTDDNMGGSR